LELKVKPWADVSVDGKARGKTPLPKMTLSPGAHTVVLSHPDFEPLKRMVDVKSGGTATLTVDFKDEAVRRKK
jgi:hypothetical protein